VRRACGKSEALLALLFAAVLGCASEQTGSGDASRAPDAVAATGSDADGEVSTLVVNAVCRGIPSDCPSSPPPAGTGCSKNLLCCVYQPSPGTLAGCTCFQGAWLCAAQACGCP
jgi:hypothetical protein